MKESQITENRFLELSQKATDRYIKTFTNFLNVSELEEFSKIKNKLPSNYLLTGGIENAERKVVIFSYEDDINFNNVIAFLKIYPSDYKFGEFLSHKNYLGAIMNMGIDRSLVGDILISGKDAYVICVCRIADYIKTNLTNVNRTSVRVEIVENLPPELKIKLKDVIISSPSNRIDAIISKMYNLSRKESASLFNDRCVYVNDRLCVNNSYLLKPEDIVSVRGYGRFCFVNMEHETKKGGFVFLCKKYTQ